MEKRDSILLPSHNQCLELMDTHGMLPNIREHSFRVMEVAGFLGEALAEAGFDLNLPLVTVGALLHDLGKTQCLGTLQQSCGVGGRHPGCFGLPPRGPGGPGARLSRRQHHGPPAAAGGRGGQLRRQAGAPRSGGHPQGPLCRPQGALRDALPRPWPASRQRKSGAGPWRTSCLPPCA